MKVRSGFVSNSSSSSFVVIKDALCNDQIDMILSYQYYIDEFLKNDEIDEEIRENFDYYSSDPWQIIEYEDFIFGETSMDNFDMSYYLNYIKIDSSAICWDDGYVDKPWNAQLDFIKKMKQSYRKNKINNINKN